MSRACWHTSMRRLGAPYQSYVCWKYSRPREWCTVEPLHNRNLGDSRKRPLWGGKGVIWQIFFRKYNMFIELSWCLLYPIMIIQSYITFRDEILKKKTGTTFWIKMLTWENEQGSQHSLQVRRQFMLTSAVKLEHNQNTIDCMAWLIINEPHGSNFYDHSWPFLQSLIKKTDRGREVSWQLWTHLISSRSAIVERFK